MDDLVRKIVLSPCRWCKGTESLVINHGVDWVAVGCGDCGASGPEYFTEIQAIAAWNTRAKQDEIHEET